MHDIFALPSTAAVSQKTFIGHKRGKEKEGVVYTGYLYFSCEHVYWCITLNKLPNAKGTH